MLQNNLFRSPNINTSYFAIRRGHPHLLVCMRGHLLFLIWLHSVNIRLLFLIFCLTLRFKLIWIENRFMRDQASMNLKTELTIVTAPASTNVALSPVPEDIFSFGYRRILQRQVHSELWRHFLGLVYYPLPQILKTPTNCIACSTNVLRQYSQVLTKKKRERK